MAHNVCYIVNGRFIGLFLNEVTSKYSKDIEHKNSVTESPVDIPVLKTTVTPGKDDIDVEFELTSKKERTSAELSDVLRNSP
jgi:hypothetical protein